MISLKHIAPVHEGFLREFKESYNLSDFRDTLSEYRSDDIVDVHGFIDALIESGRSVKLTYIQYWFTKQELEEYLTKPDVPILVFKRNAENQIMPYRFRKEGKVWISEECSADNISKEELSEFDFETLFYESTSLYGEENEGKYLVLSAMYNRYIFSGEKDVNAVAGTRYVALRRLFQLLRNEKEEISHLLIYAVIAGFISLSLPLGIQSLISFVSSGQVSTSVVVLISFIVIGTLASGGMVIMEFYLAEMVQQRLFAKIAFNFATKIPRIKLEAWKGSYPPELVNRFFDVMTLQKGVAKILVDLSAAFLQILFGLILLSFYHSSFIFFGLFIALVLVLIIRYTGPNGLSTALVESKYKYKLVHWFEELARAVSTFKLAANTNLHIEKTDHLVTSYLYARKEHFKVLITQYFSFVVFKTVITAGLLILGTVLLLNIEINLGEFVATEIIVILIMSSVEKVIAQLDTVYDVLTGLEKVAQLTDLEMEEESGFRANHLVGEGPFSLSVEKLSFIFPQQTRDVLKNISFQVNPGEKIVVTGFANSGKSTLMQVLLGYLSGYKGSIAYNQLSLKDYRRSSLIRYIGDNIAQEDVFEGSILENITLGRAGIKMEDVVWAMEQAGLSSFVLMQKDGLQTKLIRGVYEFPKVVMDKIVLARSIVIRPKLMMLEDMTIGMRKEEKYTIYQKLFNKQAPWSMLFVSDEELAFELADRILVLNNGEVQHFGPYTDPAIQKTLQELL